MREDLQLGDFYDNQAALDLIRAKIGRREEIKSVKPALERMRDHILSTGEHKSGEYLLPDIRALLAAIEEMKS